MEWSGEGHVETMAIRHNLAQMYLAWGKRDEASSLLQKNVELMEDSVNNKN